MAELEVSFVGSGETGWTCDACERKMAGEWGIRGDNGSGHDSGFLLCRPCVERVLEEMKRKDAHAIAIDV